MCKPLLAMLANVGGQLISFAANSPGLPLMAASGCVISAAATFAHMYTWVLKASEELCAMARTLIHTCTHRSYGKGH